MMYREWTSHDGRIRLILADNRQFMPTLPDGFAPAVVTDPPYGIGEAAGKNKSRSCLGISKDYGNDDWDNEPCGPWQIAEMRRLSKWQVVFGGNYFELPPTSCYLVWDKLNGNNDFADCELAWTNLKRATRRLQFRWHGMIRDEDGERVHPTQKPIGVMVWAMSWLPAECDLIFDPFMGSGTTAIACIRTDRRFVGIEYETKHFENAVERVKSELNRAPLFEPAPAVQRSLLAEAVA